MDWDEAGGSGVLGAGAGNLETKAPRDLYTFALPAGGQSTYLEIGRCPYYGKWQLMSQGTGVQIATGPCWAGDKRINNLPTGAYTLDFHGIKEALGTYSSEIR